MSYAAVVLYNNRNSLASVDFIPVTDALLSGGVFLSETSVLPYDDTERVGTALARLEMEHDGVIVVCDGVLVPQAKKAVEIAAGATFGESAILETQNCIFAVLSTGMVGASGVKTLVERIDRRRNQSYFRMHFRTVGAPTETLAETLSKVRQACGEQILVHVFERYADAHIELIYDKVTPKYTADEATRILVESLGEYLYALEEKSVAERLVDALKIRRRKISVAESFTGGGVGRAIVRVPGASEVYFEGLNTYSGKSKEERLGVKPFTVNHRGTVSEETAYEMAAGLLAGGNCDLAVATTGVAGPNPDEKNNPVGLCYIAVGTQEEVKVYNYRFTGTRESITETAINFALFLAYKELK